MKLKTAILAIEPNAIQKEWFPQINSVIRSMQRKQLIDQVLVLTVNHPGAYLVPWALYNSRKFELADQLEADIERAVQDDFFASGVRVISSDSSLSDDIAKQICEFSEIVDPDLLILVREKRSSFSKWLIPSVSEQVEKLSPVPVLIIEPTAEESSNLIDNKIPKQSYSIASALSGINAY